MPTTVKVTAILRNLTPEFYTGSQFVNSFNAKSNEDKLNYCFHNDLARCITTKIGNGSFRDQVELNGLLRRNPAITYKIEPRKGYKLATFEVTA